MPKIIVSRNSHFYNIFSTGKTTYIGRGPGNDVVLTDSSVSRKHARIDLTEKGYYLIDEGSKNGTFIGDRAIHSHPLTHGTSFQIQDFRLTFVNDLGVEDQIQTGGATISKQYAESWDEATCTGFIRPMEQIWDTGEKLTRLIEIVMDLHTASSDVDTGALVLNAFIELTGAKRGILARLHKTAGPIITHMQGFDPNGKIPESIRSVLTDVLDRDTSVVEMCNDKEIIKKMPFTSEKVLCMPLLKGSETIGCLYLDHSDADNIFADIDYNMVLAATGYIAEALIEERGPTRGLGRDEQQLARELERKGIIARSKKTLKVFKDTLSIAHYNVAVLIYGETGSGKEVIARYIHENSGRKGKFIACNCSAIAGALVESELFGHEKGAFTGAAQQKPGLLELADQGTIFLDEIGDMPMEQQSKLLRVLQEQEVWRVGGRAAVKIDVRVISATHKDIKNNREQLEFRDDLYYRLANVEITAPPLRDRVEDIAPLSRLILKDLNVRHLNGEKNLSISSKALRLLEAYDWPGNIRELRNTLFQVATRCDGDIVERQHLKGLLNVFEGSSQKSKLPIVPLIDVERQHIIMAMEFTSWNKSAAAKLLKIDRNRLNRRIKKLGIQEPAS
ncbi:sigma 54-interacting transcriptional regulator [Desulfosarcina variabilis]|uniref:sigma 54-interacting transcriptional regulator n=1 Tax=Desulfosarcina variabilis TaxID=2300 RepID=UPI003AFAA3C2